MPIKHPFVSGYKLGIRGGIKFVIVFHHLNTITSFAVTQIFVFRRRYFVQNSLFSWRYFAEKFGHAMNFYYHAPELMR